MSATGETTTVARFPWAFFLLVFVLALPLWAPAAVTGWTFPIVTLPLSALVAFCPAIAALLVAAWRAGTADVTSLLKRTLDSGETADKRWYLPIFLLMPAIMTVEFGVTRAMGTAPPKPRVPLLLVPPLFLVFCLFAIGEELGWTGYATDPLLVRWPALGAALLLGAIWAAWHLVSFVQTGHGQWWVAWQSATTIGLRVLIVWLYANAGQSLFAAIPFHAMANLSELLYPNLGSGYDPFLTAIIMALVIVAIVPLWGAQTLARFRFA